jgi:hypothetical protein
MTTLLMASTACAGDRGYCTNQNTPGRHGYWYFRIGKVQMGHMPTPQGPPAYEANGKLKRFYDDRGRWTGDGYDSMATVPMRRN